MCRLHECLAYLGRSQLSNLKILSLLVYPLASSATSTRQMFNGSQRFILLNKIGRVETRRGCYGAPQDPEVGYLQRMSLLKINMVHQLDNSQRQVVYVSD